MKKILPLTVLVVILLSGCRSSIVDDPTTTIRYTVVKERSQVLLTIENSYDTRIATLVNEVQDAGIHHVAFSMSYLPEGIYFYTVDMRGIYTGVHTVDARKMLLIK